MYHKFSNRTSFKYCKDLAKRLNLDLYKYQRLGDRANYYYEYRLSNSNKIYTSLKKVKEALYNLMDKEA